jgi:hypothetical protein
MKKNQDGKTKTKEKLIAEIPLSGTKQIRIAISEYKGNKYFAMREQYKTDADDDEWLFGKQGLNLPIKRLTPKSCKQLSVIFSKLAEKLNAEDDDGDD